MSAWLALLLCASIAEDPSFLEGQRLYRALEYEQAIFRFQEVAVRPALAADDRAEVLVWLGLSYAGTGDLEAAQRNFKDALMVHAAVALPDNSPPRVKERFDAARAELSPPPPAASAPVPPANEASTQQDPPGERADSSPLFVPGIVAASAGGVALVGGAVVAALAYVSYSSATDPTAFQDDAKASLDRANVGAIAAGIMLPLGAVLGGAGAAMITISMAAE